MITTERRTPLIGELFLEREVSTRSFRLVQLKQVLDNGQWLVYNLDSEEYYTTPILSTNIDTIRQVFTSSTA